MLEKPNKENKAQNKKRRIYKTAKGRNKKRENQEKKRRRKGIKGE